VDREAPARKAAHDLGDDADELEDVIDVGREVDRGPSQQLALKDCYRVEPVERLRFRAYGDTLAIVSFAVAPQANIVEVVETECPGDGVDEDRIRDRGWDDVAEVQLEEVDVPEDGFVVRRADLYHDKEND